MTISNTLTDKQNDLRVQARDYADAFVRELPEDEMYCDGCEYLKRTIQPSFVQMNAGSIERGTFAVCNACQFAWEYHGRPRRLLECLLANAKEI